MFHRLPRSIQTVSTFAISAIAAFSLLNPLTSLAEVPTYHVTDKLHLDGDVKWDYLTVDAEHRHLFIAHSNRVDVFDVDKKQLAGEILDTPGVHGVALAQEFDRGFTSNGKSNSVTIFSLSTLKSVGTVSTGKNPDAIVYDPASKLVFVGNGASNSLTPINAMTGNALTEIALAGKPEFMAFDGDGHLFVNLEDTNEVAVIDTRHLTVTARHDLSAQCDGPTGLSFDTALKRLFVGCQSRKLSIVDVTNWAILDTVPIGYGNDATAFDKAAQLTFASNGDGTLSVVAQVDAAHYQVQQTVSTMPGAKTMAIDPATHKIYLVAAETKKFDGVDSVQSKQRPSFKPGTFTLITVSP